MDKESKRQNLFVIQVNSPRSIRFKVMRAPVAITEYQFEELMERLKNEEWNKLSKFSDYINGKELYQNIMKRLKEGGWEDLSPPEYRFFYPEEIQEEES